MIKEQHLDAVIVIIIILCGGLILFQISSWWIGDSTNHPQKSPISQTIAPDKSNAFNLTLENEGSESGNVINRSMVDTVQIETVQP